MEKDKITVPGGGSWVAAPTGKFQLKNCLTLPGTFGAIGDHMRLYLNAFYAPSARLHKDLYRNILY
jgi:hypothetical protein